MFGLSWGQITIIVLVGVFVLGPERIPTAVSWVLTGARKVRTMASGAQADLVRELGPEIADLRRQIAELQSLRQLPELREMLDLDPGRLTAGSPFRQRQERDSGPPEVVAIDGADKPLPPPIESGVPQ